MQQINKIMYKTLKKRVNVLKFFILGRYVAWAATIHIPIHVTNLYISYKWNGRQMLILDVLQIEFSS